MGQGFHANFIFLMNNWIWGRFLEIDEAFNLSLIFWPNFYFHFGKKTLQWTGELKIETANSPSVSLKGVKIDATYFFKI
jgi:hypothetical protein